VVGYVSHNFFALLAQTDLMLLFLLHPFCRAQREIWQSSIQVFFFFFNKKIQVIIIIKKSFDSLKKKKNKQEKKSKKKCTID